MIFPACLLVVPTWNLLTWEKSYRDWWLSSLSEKWKILRAHLGIFAIYFSPLFHPPHNMSNVHSTLLRLKDERFRRRQECLVGHTYRAEKNILSLWRWKRSTKKIFTVWLHASQCSTSALNITAGIIIDSLFFLHMAMSIINYWCVSHAHLLIVFRKEHLYEHALNKCHFNGSEKYFFGIKILYHVSPCVYSQSWKSESSTSSSPFTFNFTCFYSLYVWEDCNQFRIEITLSCDKKSLN